MSRFRDVVDKSWLESVINEIVLQSKDEFNLNDQESVEISLDESSI